MELTHNQFEILTYLERNKNGKNSQRQLSSNLNLSLGTINKVIGELNSMEYLNTKTLQVTKKGIQALEPYRVKRAIFLAAGFGSRLVPLTFNTPKPLIKVHGKRMIETLLDAVVKAEIEEVIIVRGYLKEQFDILKNIYPNIKFIDNNLFNEANNISSALMAKDYLSNAYVLESDLVLSNQDLIRKYEYHSNFLGIKVKRTDDWCFDVKNGIIIKQKVGGENCYQMVGISYYDEKDGIKLKKDIYEAFYCPGGKEKYWEQIPLVEKKENYKIYIRECQSEDIIEIDTFNELKSIDNSYIL